MKNEELPSHVLCSMQQVFAGLANANLSPAGGSHKKILGFKELVALPSSSSDLSLQDASKAVPHLHAWNTAWLDFIDRLFPCARIVFNTRRDSATQSRAIASTFDSARGLPLHKIERDVKVVNANLEKWHAERSSGNTSKSRSFMMYAEDLAPSRFTQLAHWLGLNCTFHAIPHANDPNATHRRRAAQRAEASNGAAEARWERPYFHRDYASIRWQCDDSRVSPEVAEESVRSPVTSSTLLQPPHAYEEELDHEVEPGECKALPSLPPHPTCGPAPEDVARLLGSREALWDRSSSNLSEVPTFFLHEGGVFNFSDATSCYMRAVGGDPHVDDMDKHVYPDVAEHLADMWYLEQFRTHPRRVHDPADAMIHVIGIPFTAAFRAHRGEKWNPSWKAARLGGKAGGPYGCGTMDELRARLGKVTQHLRNSFYYQRQRGRDWLLLNSYYWVKDVLGDELRELALQGPMMFTTSDRQYVHYRELLNESGLNPEVIPYKSHFALDDAAWIDSKYPQTTRRHLQLMFHGSTGRGSSTSRRKNYTEGALRGLLCDVLRDSFGDNSSLKCVTHYAAHATTAATSATSLLQIGESRDVLAVRRKKPPVQTWLAVTSGRRASLQTVQSYLNSKLCPVPAGDTPTSRRLFDAMAGGCVPILFTPFEDIAPNLPFPKSVNWRKLVLFGGGLSCSILEHRKETIAWLRELLNPAHEAKLNCLSKRVRSTYRKHLSLRGHGAVTSLLLELQRSPKSLGWVRSDPRVPMPSPNLTACHVEARCGCSDQQTIFVRYHLTGQRLMQDLVGELESACDMPDVKLVEAGLSMSENPGACRNLKLSLDEDNLPLWPLERLKNLSQPRSNTRFVHLIREPLALLAEYYTYHAAAPVSKVGSVYTALSTNLTEMTFVDGVAHVAELLLQRHLPAMVNMHALFGHNCNEIGCTRKRDDVAEVRYEDLLTSFDEQISRIGRAVGVAQHCTDRSNLQEAFERHRPRNVHMQMLCPGLESCGTAAAQGKGDGNSTWVWYMRNAAGATQIDDAADAAALAGLPSALASLLQERSSRSIRIVRRLLDIGQKLGYKYSPGIRAFAGPLGPKQAFTS